MKISLTKAEKTALAKIVGDDTVYKSAVFPRVLSLLAGGLLLIAPTIFCSVNLSGADGIVRRLGVYIGAMILVGVSLCAYSAFLALEDKKNKEIAVLHSAVKKIAASGVLELG